MKNLPRKRSYLRFLNPYIPLYSRKTILSHEPRHLSSHYRSFAHRYKTFSFSIQHSRKKHPRLVSNVISPMVARDEWSNLYDTRDRFSRLRSLAWQFLKIVSHAHLDLSIILLNLITVHAFLFFFLFFFFFSVSLLPYTRTARVSLNEDKRTANSNTRTREQEAEPKLVKRNALNLHVLLIITSSTTHAPFIPTKQLFFARKEHFFARPEYIFAILRYL